jgi:GNAT superfamily N-acetyltransferase
MIAVRPAAPADVEAMSRVLIASITALCAPDHAGDPQLLSAWTANKTPTMVEAMLRTPGVRLFVAERDGEIAAVGAILRNDEIGLNYVAPAHRFAGVSKALLAAMEETMRAGGVTEGRLNSTETAHRFYRAAGWQDTGAPRPERPLAGWPMTKRL